MGLYLLALLLICIGFLLYRYDNGLAQVLVWWVGYCLLVLLISISLSVLETNNRAEINYQLLTKKIESIQDKEITDTERSKLIEEVTDMNYDIMTTQKLHGNFWTGCFYVKNYAGLELIDLNRIKQAKFNLGVDGMK